MLSLVRCSKKRSTWGAINSWQHTGTKGRLSMDNLPFVPVCCRKQSENIVLPFDTTSTVYLELSLMLLLGQLICFHWQTAAACLMLGDVLSEGQGGFLGYFHNVNVGITAQFQEIDLSPSPSFSLSLSLSLLSPSFLSLSLSLSVSLSLSLSLPLSLSFFLSLSVSLSLSLSLPSFLISLSSLFLLLCAQKRKIKTVLKTCE